ncbi:unnamed protein product [Adineta ricciae]|uniref:Uncharacterized protein n=1 Tax=Adineta ricciae TaxID=249248 RepID=A0A815CLX9_ADIRI|nr:unnamed protein product [Adineta ricciae]CAF1282066.1 unnamed protein product [Adineta ricciae]
MPNSLLDIIKSCSSNSQQAGSQPTSREINIPGLCSEALAAWGVEHPADLSYRVELARRIALAFDDSDQIIILDDVALVVPESERAVFLGMRGCDRSLLPALWLSTGFRRGGRLIVYSPPNSVELANYFALKKNIEGRLQRSIQIQIFYEDSGGQLFELLSIFETNPSKYTEICERFAQRSPADFHPEYHIRMFKRHIDEILGDASRSFLFPYEMTEFHQQELQPYSDRLKLPDLPTNDKAKHNFFLRSQAFTALPKLLAVSPDGTIIDNYQQYIETLEHLDPIHTENTPQNIQVFSQAVIRAIDQLNDKYSISAFVKLDASGAAGWSCMSPSEHALIYNCGEDETKRTDYLREYIENRVLGERLPVLAVIEEFIEPQKRSGDIDADYTVCGFVLGGKLFPTSINLCGTENGCYIEQWTSCSPADLSDSSIYWQRMFQTYSTMVAFEASEFGYTNGIYAGDLFVTKDGRHKQRDWNIRRGGRSSPESLVIFGIPNYETKVTLSMFDFGLNGKLNNTELFHLYTDICQYLSNTYGIYIFSSGLGYCSKDDQENDYLKFNILIHPKLLTHIDQNGQKQKLPRSEHRNKVTEMIRDATTHILKKKSLI